MKNPAWCPGFIGDLGYEEVMKSIDCFYGYIMQEEP
jgi:hypothetical protein